MEYVSAIITAGGVGKRMGMDTYKQYLTIYDVPILVYTVRAFQNHKDINEIILVVPEDMVETTRNDLVNDYQLTKVVKVVTGGKERQHSVKRGLDVINEKTDIVLIHDGVRPFITAQLISSLIEETRSCSAVIPGLKPKATLKNINDNTVTETVNRNDYILVQTPQAFSKELIVEAYKQLEEKNVSVTDDASVVELTGHPVKWINGLEENIKITTPPDLAMARFILDNLSQKKYNFSK